MGGGLTVGTLSYLCDLGAGLVSGHSKLRRAVSRLFGGSSNYSKCCVFLARSFCAFPVIILAACEMLVPGRSLIKPVEWSVLHPSITSCLAESAKDYYSTVSTTDDVPAQLSIASGFPRISNRGERLHKGVKEAQCMEGFFRDFNSFTIRSAPLLNQKNCYEVQERLILIRCFDERTVRVESIESTKKYSEEKIKVVLSFSSRKLEQISLFFESVDQGGRMTREPSSFSIPTRIGG
jgi:hypothetical protein